MNLPVFQIPEDGWGLYVVYSEYYGFYLVTPPLSSYTPGGSMNMNGFVRYLRACEG